jgi:ketosteroid isomerase-like protein
MNDPKAIVRAFFEAFSRGDIDAVLGGMTDDATWWVAGQIEGMSGTNTKQQLGALLHHVKPLYRSGALTITPSAMIAEGESVAVEAESYAELVSGGVYANQYHFLIKLRDGLVQSVREYSDTHHMAQTFG